MFRVGDIVRAEDKEDNREVRFTIVKIDDYRIYESESRWWKAKVCTLIKPVWQVGDTAKILDSYDSSRVGETFVVISIDQNFVYNCDGAWSFKNLERVALAPEQPKPLTHAELKTTLARELEIPTYLYNVVEVKPRLKPGSVKMDENGWMIHIDMDSDVPYLQLRNIDGFIWDAERLRKLAKLCTDLADLMG